MKKFISAAVAVMLAMGTTSALAATSDGTLGVASRNQVEVFQTVETSTDSMPGFRAGDIIQFDVTGLTENKYLTVVSYKMGSGVALGNDTIQYVNQYVIDSETKTIEYAVRENTAEGIYKLSINGNDKTNVINFYYKVGNPDVSMVFGDGTSYNVIEEYTTGGVTKYAVGFVAKAVLGSNEVSFGDVGVAELGFKFTANGKEVTQTLTEEQFNAIEQASMYAETDGGVAFVYGVTIYGMTSMDEVNSIKAEAYKADK